jgi:REP element-mobilizing transposase RayT
MSRPLRIEYAGAWYHVMNRGRRREKIFEFPIDYELFLGVLQETSTMWNLQVSAYCLLSNHYHLLVHTPDGNISRCMRHINGVYTQRYNRRHKQDGQLFRGRYKAVVVDGDSYLLEVLRYIHRNSIKAGCAEIPADYNWSSHQGYLSSAKKWDWLYKDFLLSMFSEKSREAKKAYLEFVSRKEPEEIEKFYSKKNMSSILGTADFKEWLQQKFQDFRFHREIPESMILAPDPANILDLVSKHYKLKRELLTKSKRGRENVPRDIAVYLMRIYSNETLAGVGRYFDIPNYSTVSSIIERVKRRKKTDKVFAGQVKMFEKELGKSQRET